MCKSVLFSGFCLRRFLPVGVENVSTRYRRQSRLPIVVLRADDAHCSFERHASTELKRVRRESRVTRSLSFGICFNNAYRNLSDEESWLLGICNRHTATAFCNSLRPISRLLFKCNSTFPAAVIYRTLLVDASQQLVYLSHTQQPRYVLCV